MPRTISGRCLAGTIRHGMICPFRWSCGKQQLCTMHLRVADGLKDGVAEGRGRNVLQAPSLARASAR